MGDSSETSKMVNRKILKKLFFLSDKKDFVLLFCSQKWFLLVDRWELKGTV
jgi:hypothetical protein